FAREYTGRTTAHPRRTYALLALPLLAIVPLAFTDSLHGLVRSAPRLVPGEPFSQLTYGFTPAMLAWSAYLLALTAAAVVLLARQGTHAHPLYRAQVALVQLGVLVPLAGAVLTLTVLAESTARDVTPLTLALGNLLVAWGLTRRQLFDVAPVARHAVVESMRDAVYVLDADDRVVDLNPAASASLPPGAPDPIGRPAAEVLPLPTHLLPTAGERREVELADRPERRHAEVAAHPLPGPRGEAGGRVVVVRDVSERVAAAEALARARDELEQRVLERTAELRQEVEQRAMTEAGLRESEALFRTVVENLHEAVLLTDLRGVVTFASARVADVTGYAPEELVGRRAGELMLSPAELAASDRRLEARGRGESARWEVPITRKDGTTAWVEAIGTAILNEAGETVGGLDAVADVTERRRAAQELQAVQERFRMMVETVRDYAIVALDPDGYVVSWNAGAERITGYAAEEILGRRISVFYAPEEVAAGAVEATLAETLREGRCELDGWRVRRDGSRFWANTVITPLRGEQGELLGFTAVTRDLTDRRTAAEALRASEEQLRHAQKLEAVGRLAGGIAHDFNNVLMAVGGHVQLLRRRTAEDDPARHSLEEIKKGVDRAAALVAQLLAFSRRQVMQPRVLELRRVVGEMEGMLDRLIGAHVALSLRLDPATPWVRADAGQLEQVVLNLVVNARDAVAGGGSIRVETGAAELTPADAARHPFLRPGRYASLTVVDDGCGMDAATLELAFEPFFTTKEPGKGTGLGLSTVYGIVKQSGGYVIGESVPGVGTTFRVYLPPVEAPAARTQAEPPGPTPSGWETVLVAEEDDAVRGVVRETLRLRGYRVLEARSGAEALELAEAHPSAIHLLLADPALTERGGAELARRVLALHPEARVLRMSGARAGGGGRILRKPVLPDVLARLVREALDRPAGAVR
ncbi:MAG TPA: PAS domain S-box protein, partial [Longimicrobiaceae bacterium]|nr:PAS domain S-box protein [Longimicrobiaceae bacterium]